MTPNRCSLAAMRYGNAALIDQEPFHGLWLLENLCHQLQPTSSYARINRTTPVWGTFRDDNAAF
jgi:hypothetical protein